MSGGRRFLIAGSGALAPLIVNLAVIDLQSLLAFGITLMVAASYLLRQATMFGIGGLFGYLNEEESPWKLFQIGIAAPALLTAMINAKQVGVPQVSGANVASQSSTLSFLEDRLAPPAFADENESDGTKVFSLPQESYGQQFARGYFGSVPANVWYVIAGSFPTREDAFAQAAIIRNKGFQASVYRPYGSNPSFAVVIGAQLTLIDAQRLRERAIAAGLPTNTYLWTFPPTS
jgi:hypothetical protein